MSDYLWDGSGKPDPETQRLENLLGRFRHNCPAPDFSQVSVESEERSRLSWVRGWWSFPRLAIATAVAILAVGSWYGYRISRPAWNVVRVAGTPQVGSRSIHANGRLGIGEYLQTDANSRAQINVGAVGTVDIEPNTRLRLLQARATEHRLALDHGTIHAYIWAPPRLFTVDTPSAVAVDLGCQYTLHVDPDGRGELRVTYGWVAFEQDGQESFVPADAVALTRPGFGPGTPFFEDASATLRSALENLDFDLVLGGVAGGVTGGVKNGISGGVPGGVPGGVDGGVVGGVHGGIADGVETLETRRAGVLGVVLSKARKRDALTLWHLLSRTTGIERARVYDRLTQLVPPPPGVSREGILAGDATTQRAMRDLWWDTLGLGDTSWWRMWKGPVPTR
jgi:hypothetical protein